MFYTALIVIRLSLLVLLDVPAVSTALHPAVHVAVVVSNARDAQHILKQSHTVQISWRPDNGFPAEPSHARR